MNVTQEPDHVNHKGVLITALATAAVTVIGVLIAWALLEWKLANLSSSAAPVSARAFRVPAEVNATETTLFDSLDGGSRRLGDGERLRSYGFVDRTEKRVHVPIRRAMQLFIERQRDEPTQESGAPTQESGTPEPQPLPEGGQQ